MITQAANNPSIQDFLNHFRGKTKVSAPKMLATLPDCTQSQSVSCDATVCNSSQLVYFMTYFNRSVFFSLNLSDQQPIMSQRSQIDWLLLLIEEGL